MFFLSDISTSNYARRVGSKDKQPRKRNNLLRNAAIGAGVAGLGLGALYLTRRNIAANKKVVQDQVNRVNKINNEFNEGIRQVNEQVRKHNSTVNSNVSDIPKMKTVADVDNFINSKAKVNKDIVTRAGSTNINNVNRALRKVKGKARKSTFLERSMNPNVWGNKRVGLNFNRSSKLAEFARRKGSKDKVKRMSRLGAGLRIGIPATLAAGMGAGLGYMGAIGGTKKGKLISSLAGATLLGGGLAGASYMEHKASPYSPVGKKKWRNYPVEPKVYGIPVQRLSIIKGLDQQ